MAGIADDRPRRHHLAIVEIEKRAVIVDRRDADHRPIDLELRDELDRALADDAAVGLAHHAAGDDHLDRAGSGVRMWATWMLLVMTSRPS